MALVNGGPETENTVTQRGFTVSSMPETSFGVDDGI